jgi:hypothetical protein
MDANLLPANDTEDDTADMLLHGMLKDVLKDDVHSGSVTCVEGSMRA